MRVLVTGANGFIGKNLTVKLREQGVDVVPISRQSPLSLLKSELAQVEFVFHLAGVNRPKDAAEFAETNWKFTDQICQLCREQGKKPTLIYTSSAQATNDSPYGKSKRQGELALEALHRETGTPVFVYRLPGVFGKWSRPHYNSVVATFCQNISEGKSLEVHDPNATVELVYIDDVIDSFMHILKAREEGFQFRQVEPRFSITVGALAEKIESFKSLETSLQVDRVGSGLDRALFATFLSFLRPEQFSYPLPVHTDARGAFSEIVKTQDSGQLSFFTAHPGITRGGHYHHTKNEKFVVVQGEARFRFRHITTGETSELNVSGTKPQVVRTIPGWAHDITNIGSSELIVILWANENFERARPDTISFGVEDGTKNKSHVDSGHTPGAY